MTYISILPFHRVLMIALVMTVLIELVVLLCLKKFKNLWLLSIGINIITNITFNLINRQQSAYDMIYILSLEMMIILIESLIYYIKLKNYKAVLMIAILCNLASYIIGMLLIPYVY